MPEIIIGEHNWQRYVVDHVVDGERKATVPITVSQMPTSPVQPPQSPKAPGS